MSSPLTLIVLGQAYFLGSLPHTPTESVNRISVPSIGQPLIQNETRALNYTYIPGIGSYKVHTKVTSWIKALTICQEEGAHLAVINSRAEANAIAQLVEKAGPHPNSYSPDYAWIGTHDLISHKGDYETIFGESLAQAGFEEWHEPKSLEGPHCGAAWRDGELSWFACTRALGYICELSSTDSRFFPTPTNGADDGISQATWWIKESLKRKLGNVGSLV